jgi:hypothetical protein
LDNGSIAAKAVQVNLNVDEVGQRLIETAGRQIVGIFWGYKDISIKRIFFELFIA